MSRICTERGDASSTINGIERGWTVVARAIEGEATTMAIISVYAVPSIRLHRDTKGDRDRTSASS